MPNVTLRTLTAVMKGGFFVIDPYIQINSLAVEKT